MTTSPEQHKSEREEFEAWALREGHAYRDEKHGICWYEGGAKTRQWQGWQAGRASMLRPIPEVEGDTPDLRNWGALVFPVLDKASKALKNVEAEDITEQSLLDDLINALSDLSIQYATITRPSPPSNVEPT